MHDSYNSHLQLYQSFFKLQTVVYFVLIQVCDSSTLCPEALALLAATMAAASPQAGPPAPELLAKLLAALTNGGDGVMEECAICLGPLELPCITPCGHIYCRRSV